MNKTLVALTATAAVLGASAWTVPATATNPPRTASLAASKAVAAKRSNVELTSCIVNDAGYPEASFRVDNITSRNLPFVGVTVTFHRKDGTVFASSYTHVYNLHPDHLYHDTAFAYSKAAGFTCKIRNY